MLYNILFFICTWLFWASYFYFTHKIKWEYSLFYHYLSFGCVVGLTSKIVELSFSFFLSFLLCMGICILCLFKCVYMSKYISVHVYVQVSSMGGCTCMYRSLGQILGICLHFYTTMFFEAGPYEQTWSLQNGNSQSLWRSPVPNFQDWSHRQVNIPNHHFHGFWWYELRPSCLA